MQYFYITIGYPAFDRTTKSPVYDSAVPRKLDNNNRNGMFTFNLMLVRYWKPIWSLKDMVIVYKKNSAVAICSDVTRVLLSGNVIRQSQSYEGV